MTPTTYIGGLTRHLLTMLICTVILVAARVLGMVSYIPPQQDKKVEYEELNRDHIGGRR